MYKLLVLLTCHESRDCVVDNVENIFKFNRDVCVIISNGIHNENFHDISGPHVHIVNRPPKGQVDSLIPLHVELWDYARTHGIQSQYVVTPASNQMFIRHGFYDFACQYHAGYFERGPLDIKTGRDMNCNCADQHCDIMLDVIGREYFRFQSNHDGMFYRADIFSNMMDFFADTNRNRRREHGSEEFLYGAYLFKHVPPDQMVGFAKYNHWDHNPSSPERIDQLRDQGIYLLKRVPRFYDDPSRVYIRSLV